MQTNQSWLFSEVRITNITYVIFVILQFLTLRVGTLKGRNCLIWSADSILDRCRGDTSTGERKRFQEDSEHDQGLGHCKELGRL